MLNEINTKIEALKEGQAQDVVNQLEILEQQAERVSKAKFSMHGVSEIVKNNSNVLDSGAIPADLVDQVKSIQNEIVEAFGE